MIWIDEFPAVRPQDEIAFVCVDDQPIVAFRGYDAIARARGWLGVLFERQEREAA